VREIAADERLDIIWAHEQTGVHVLVVARKSGGDSEWHQIVGGADRVAESEGLDLACNHIGDNGIAQAEKFLWQKEVRFADDGYKIREQ